MEVNISVSWERQHVKLGAGGEADSCATSQINGIWPASNTGNHKFRVQEQEAVGEIGFLATSQLEEECCILQI